jgi:hypothetical protein
MLGFYSLPIRKKITRLVATVVSVALMLMLVTLTFVQTERKWTALRNRMEIQADIIGAQIEPAIKFNDKKGAEEEILSALKADTIILSAIITTEDNSFVASYTNPVTDERLAFLPDFMPTQESISRSFIHQGNAIKRAPTQGQVVITVNFLSWFCKRFIFCI